jgi:hypothetical protein
MAIALLVLVLEVGAPGRIDASELVLAAGNSPVELDEETAGELTAALIAYFATCHRYSDVARGAQVPQAELEGLWSEQMGRTYATMPIAGAPGDRRDLGVGSLTLLFGFDEKSGPHPVLARDEDGALTSFIKCAGLEGLLLTCRVHDLMPGMTPSADCERWEAMHRLELPSLSP